MILMKEANKLLKVTIIYDGNHSYTMSAQGGAKVFRGTVEEFAKFLRKVKAKDSKSEPKSVRKIKYLDMAKQAQERKTVIIYVWNYMWKKFPKGSYAGAE